MPGENLDMSSEPDRPVDRGPASGARRFLGIQFACCGVYARIYVNRSQTAYSGFCPRCSRRVHFPIGGGGTDCRFFTVY